jgi:hypothetical protein
MIVPTIPTTKTVVQTVARETDLARMGEAERIRGLRQRNQRRVELLRSHV